MALDEAMLASLHSEVIRLGRLFLEQKVVPPGYRSEATLQRAEESPMSHTKALILIVEDEPKIARVEAAYLEQAGYRTRVVHDGLEALPAVRESDPALVVLDLMLPGRDGLDICRELRGFSQVPVIMVTARVEEVDRLPALKHEQLHP